MTRVSYRLYPEYAPYDSGFYDTGDGHTLYYARFGNPNGKKAVYLHGGPGGGCSFQEYRMFDPAHFDILIFDQRGAGQSRPYASITNNSIRHLVEDIDGLRRHFDIKSWSVCGGSWGSALAMFYTAAYPMHIERLLLRGICFADTDGADFINDARGNNAANQYFEAYKHYIPPDERDGGLMAPYYKRVISPDADIALAAAVKFTLWDTSVVSYTFPKEDMEKIVENPQSILALARIWFHFCAHEFTNEHRNYLLKAMSDFDRPVHIIHGLQDYLCRPESAVTLHSVCQNAALHLFNECGHTQAEPQLRKAFIDITNNWRDNDCY